MNINRYSFLKVPGALLCVILFLTSCTVYTEKQSEALSQSVYLANDSFDKGRFDVTDTSLDEAIRIVKVPKKRLEIDEATRQTTNSTTTVTSPSLVPISPLVSSRERVLIVPERFRGQPVIIVNSNEYNELLKDKKFYEQIQKDYKKLADLKTSVDKELAIQAEYKQKLIIDLNKLQKEVIAKNFLILKLYIVIGGLVLTIVGGVYLRMKGIL